MSTIGRVSQRIFLRKVMPEVLRKGGMWNIDDAIDIETVEEYCEDNGLKYICVTPFSHGKITPLGSFVQLLSEHIERAFLCESEPKTILEANRFRKELLEDPIISLLSCFEYLKKSHGTQIILYARCGNSFPMEDEEMSALHSSLEQSRRSIALIFQHRDYNTDLVKHLTYKKMNTVFISYKHDDQVNRYVELITAGLEDNEINYSIDVKDLNYRENIREYEELIGKSSRCIVIVTPEYLESSHCMYELTQILEHRNIEERIYPLVDTGKYTRDSSGLELLRRFWMERRAESLANASSPSTFTVRELADIDKILHCIDEFWIYIHDINTSNIAELTANNSENLVAEILKDMVAKESINLQKRPQLNTEGLTRINSDRPMTNKVLQSGYKPIYIENVTGTININN